MADETTQPSEPDPNAPTQLPAEPTDPVVPTDPAAPTEPTEPTGEEEVVEVPAEEQERWVELAHQVIDFIALPEKEREEALRKAFENAAKELAQAVLDALGD
jgi:hypothetical protein